MTLKVAILTKVLKKETNQGTFKHAYQLVNSTDKLVENRIISGDSDSYAGKMLFDLVRLPIRVFPIKADLYHAMMPEDAIWPVIMNKRPLIANIYDVIPLTYKKESKLITRIYFWLACKFAVKSDLVITCSEYSKKEIMQVFGAPSEKVRVIPVGIETEDFKVKNTGSSANTIGYIGGFRKRKNVPMIIKAFSRVLSEVPDAELVIGGKGKELDQLKELAVSLGIEKSVKFTGYVSEDDLPNFYSKLTAFVFPSDYEGFGMPPLEAMACGTPVIVSNKTSLPEVAGDCGLTVEPNEKELSSAMTRLLKDKKLREKLSKKSLERVKLFEWKNVAKMTLEAYKTAVKSRR